MLTLTGGGVRLDSRCCGRGTTYVYAGRGRLELAFGHIEWWSREGKGCKIVIREMFARWKWDKLRRSGLGQLSLAKEERKA
jgi:hypothetical protein